MRAQRRARRRAITAERRPPTGMWTLGAVALFRPRKGIEVLLEALAMLRSRNVNVRLRAVGGFETPLYKADVLGLAERLDLAEAIDWIGFTRNVNRELAKIDLFVLPSLFGEGLPMVVLEAMAAGLPVVASRVEGVPEAVVHRETGLLVEPGSVSQLAAGDRRNRHRRRRLRGAQPRRATPSRRTIFRHDDGRRRRRRLPRGDADHARIATAQSPEYDESSYSAGDPRPMSASKIAISLEPRLLARLDELVEQNLFPNRSRAVQEAVREKLDRIQRGRLARECKKLDPQFRAGIGRARFSGRRRVMARILRGNIHWANLDPVLGHEQGGMRPVVIVSHDVFNASSGTVIAMAITSQQQAAGFPLTFEIKSAKLPKRSWVKMSQIRTLAVERIGRRIAVCRPKSWPS